MTEINPNLAKITTYIEQNPAAVLSTAGDDGPHGAVVYVMNGNHGTVCFVTKTGTKKYANLLEKPTVALTIFNERESTTLQATGRAFVADDSHGLREMVMAKVTQAHASMSEWLPPAAKLQSGEYVVIGIELRTARLTDYASAGPNGPAVTELSS